MTETQEDTRAALIRAAKKTFALKGFDGATVKDIAEEAGVNVSLVSYHFQGKEGLFRECLIHFGEKALKSAEKLLDEPKSTEDFRVRFVIFTEEFVTRHFEEKEVAEIMYRECRGINPVIQELFDGVFFKFFNHIEAFFKKASKNKIIPPKSDANLIAVIYLGSIVHSLQHDHLFAKKFGKSLIESDFRKKFIQQLLSMVLGGTSS